MQKLIWPKFQNVLLECVIPAANQLKSLGHFVGVTHDVQSMKKEYSNKAHETEYENKKQWATAPGQCAVCGTVRGAWIPNICFCVERLSSVLQHEIAIRSFVGMHVDVSYFKSEFGLIEYDTEKGPRSNP